MHREGGASHNFSRPSQFREKLPDLPKPVFAHCKSGKRAGATVMMNIAVEQGMTGEETLQKAKEMGFECDQPELENSFGTTSITLPAK